MDGISDLGNLSFWENAPAHSSNSCKTNLILKNPVSWNNSHTPNPFKPPLSRCFDINGKMDLEKLIWTPSISDQLPETFVLSWFKLFETLFFDLIFMRSAQKCIQFNVFDYFFLSSLSSGTHFYHFEPFGRKNLNFFCQNALGLCFVGSREDNFDHYE